MQKILDELVEYQEKRLLKIANQINPRITSDDILQPNDFPELENNPYFRYEEGVLKGIHAARMAILSELSST